MPKIVLVGNSGEALNHEMGNVIDSFDVVIRMNDFAIFGYEKFVGSKTDVVICAFSGDNKLCNVKDYPEYQTREIAKSASVWSARFFDPSLDPRAYQRSNLCRNLLGHCDIKQPTKDQWDRALKEAYSGFWRQQPSTGLIAIEMSMEEYEDSEIYLYGFDFNVEKTHYFDKNYLDKDYPGDRCGHNWKGEVEYIQGLINQGKINLLKG